MSHLEHKKEAPQSIGVALITISDSRTEETDESGKLFKEKLTGAGHRIVSYALINPGIAVFLGFLFGNESAVPYLVIGLPLILVGLATMLYGQFLLRILFRGRGSRVR